MAGWVDPSVLAGASREDLIHTLNVKHEQLLKERAERAQILASVRTEHERLLASVRAEHEREMTTLDLAARQARRAAEARLASWQAAHESQLAKLREEHALAAHLSATSLGDGTAAGGARKLYVAIPTVSPTASFARSTPVAGGSSVVSLLPLGPPCAFPSLLARTALPPPWPRAGAICCNSTQHR
jgi:hypothetical protein